jgi:hypothetical protein
MRASPAKSFAMKRSIGEQVAQFMDERGLKAAAMGKLCGTSRQNIEGLIKRDRFPRDYIESLASVMGVSIDTLLAGKYGEKDYEKNSGTETSDKAGVSDVADTDSALSQHIPTSMPYHPRHLKSAILLMGSLLGALDARSRSIIGDLLKDLSSHTDDAHDIAEKASVLATVQKPITSNKALNKAIRGRGDPVETGPVPLEH